MATIDKSIPFSHLISGPLKACINAQEQASRCTWEYIRSVGLDSRNRAVTISFSFVNEGRRTKLSVPLLTIVPVPYFSIDTLDIKFRANVTEVSRVELKKEGRGTDTFKATYAMSDNSGTTATAENTINISVRAVQDDIPSGLSKVLGFMEQSVETQSIYLRLYDTQLSQALQQGSVIDEPATGLQPSTVIDGEGKPLRMTSEGFERREVSAIRLLKLSHAQYPFWSIEDFSCFHDLIGLRITDLNLSEVQTFHMAHLTRLYTLVLEGTGATLQPGQHCPLMDFAWLEGLRSLTLRRWGRGYLPQVLLTSSSELERLVLDACYIETVDISACRRLKHIEVVGGEVGSLTVWRGFAKSQEHYKYIIPKTVRIIER